jgi:PhnB protein
MTQRDNFIPTTIAPWLTVRNGVKAAEFYKAAFDAIETYRLETPDGGLIVKLSIDGAEFWISGNASGDADPNVETLAGEVIRMILTVANPDVVFSKAVEAGASPVFPIREEHGWKLGRVVDPFGLHWEIGHPLQ